MSRLFRSSPSLGRVAFFLTLAAIASQGTLIRAEEGKHSYRALLIGVSNYPNLGESYQLNGSPNDVILLKQLLVERYGFDDKNIRILTENAGKECLPTRKNIEMELRRLTQAVRAEDRVVVLLAGHGSLQPQDADTRFPQPDGFDRIFLPRDVEKWDGEKGYVPNAIRGGELGAWLRPIAEKGAVLWVIMDACHSGMGIRGVERTRQVDPVARGGLAIPHEVMLRVRKQEAAQKAVSPVKPRGEREVRPLPGLENVAILYACQPTEPTLERQLPPDASDRKMYGLLTFTLCQVLTQADSPLTYLELAQRIQRQYVSLGRSTPTPLVEGRDRNREVLGLAQHPRRSLIRLVKGEDGLKITAGRLLGLTRGSILAVYPPAGRKGDKPIGYVQLTDVAMAESEAESVSYQGQPAKKDLTDGRCQLVAADYGDLKLPVAIDCIDNNGNEVDAAKRERVATRLKRLSEKETSLFVVVSEATRAEWFVRLDSGKVYLVPGAGWPATLRKDGLPELFGPYPEDEQLEVMMEECLERIARARNLLKLASDTAPNLAVGDDADNPSVQVTVELRLLKDKTDRKGQPLEWPNTGTQLYSGDRVVFVIHNPNPYAVDVTLLDVSPDSGITCLFPLGERGETSRVEANTTRRVPPVRIAGKTSGLENLVVIAVKPKQQEQPIDFASLEQAGLEKAFAVERKRGIPTGRGLRSPLGLLLQRAQYGVGTRGARRDLEVEESSLLLYSWQFVAEKRP